MLVAILSSFAALLARAQVPNDSLRVFRNEVAAHYLNIPMANISVTNSARQDTTR